MFTGSVTDVILFAGGTGSVIDRILFAGGVSNKCLLGVSLT